MKIVFVTKGFHSASRGAESASKDWFHKISERVDATLVTDSTTIVGNSIKNSLLSFIGTANPASFISYSFSISRALKRVCREVKPDLIHMHCYSGYVAFPPSDIPVIVTFHDEPFLNFEDSISPAPIKFISAVLTKTQNFMKRLILSRNPYVHSTGTTTSEFIKTRFPKIRSCVIPNPFFESCQQAPTKSREYVLENFGIADSARIVLTVGSIENRKGIHKILDASTLIQKSKDIHFIIAGKTPNFISRSYANAIKKRKALQKNDRFHMIGFADDDLLHNLYSHADVFLSASQSEACNLSLIEAASYRLPIITSDVGAARDLFNEEAIFLSRECRPSDIARAVLSMQWRKRIQYQAHRDFNWENAMRKLLAFYEFVIKNKVNSL